MPKAAKPKPVKPDKIRKVKSLKVVLPTTMTANPHALKSGAKIKNVLERGVGTKIREAPSVADDGRTRQQLNLSVQEWIPIDNLEKGIMKPRDVYAEDLELKKEPGSEVHSMVNKARMITGPVISLYQGIGALDPNSSMWNWGRATSINN